jgi:thioredoxin 1
MITELTESNFEQVVLQPGLVIVDCWATWCGSCGQFDKTYKKVAKRHSKHSFASLDTENEKALRDSIGISYIPSLLLYRDGILIFKEPGNFDEETLNSIIAQAEVLDMEMVKAEMGKNEPETD